MRIEIEIPKEFEKHFKQDKFKDGFDRFLREYNSELLRVANQVDISYEYDDVCEWKKLPFSWFAGCDDRKVEYKQGDYCPRCGKRIRVIQNDN